MNKNEIRNLLFTKYKTLLLSRQQTAEILNISLATLDRWKKAGLYLKWKKNGTAKNATVQYQIDTIIEFIFENNSKVI